MSIHIAIIGHVDNGKSSLLSRILFPNSPGDVKELDFLPEEAERGITQEYTIHKLNHLIFVDTAGHKSYIRSNIQAYTSLPISIALIICSLRRGEFDSGFSFKGGVVLPSLREQLLLLRSGGTKKVIIVFTKADLDSSILEDEETILKPLQLFLKHIQIKIINKIRCSAKTGEGISSLIELCNSIPIKSFPDRKIVLRKIFVGKFRILFIPKNKLITAGCTFILHSNGNEAEAVLEKVKSNHPILCLYKEYIVQFVLNQSILMDEKVIVRTSDTTIGFCTIKNENAK
jgi:GTPase SAR1 family protein